MSSFRPLRSGTAVLSALTMLAGAATPIVVFQQAPVYAQTTSFSDLSSDYWARGFVQELANRGVISGFPDGSFRPNDLVTRAQFAAMVRQAFPRTATRGPARFSDVSANYWAADAIQAAYTTGFLSGYPDNSFRPDLNIPRAQVLVSLANGLGYSTAGAPGTTLQVYRDANGIPDWARSSIAAATERQIVVNYPDVSTLNPNRPATRAEVAAFIYQALVSSGQVAAIQSPYIVGSQASVPTQGAIQIPAGVTIPVQYNQAERIYVSAEEPEPVPVTLTVARNIVSQTNQVLIPENSRVEGEIRIVSGGARFYAREVILPDNTRRPINATSRIVRTTQEVNRRTNVGVVLAGAALGAGAAAGVAAVTGDRAIATEEVLGGAGLGALAGLFLGRNRVTLIAIDPASDLDLTLEEPFVIR